MFNELLIPSEEVEEAINEKKPIVVLESTLISNGIPFPENLSIAKNIEKIIRDQGAIPAIIGLYQGKIHIGIDEKLMDQLANSKTIIKASRQDIAYVLSSKITASTTVASTIFCAHLAGLPIVVTGGIGGVHVSENCEISADLKALGSTPITVVCSGAKSILDLPKTLEILETNGVAVIGYRTNEFPAFFSQSSGIPLLHRLDSPEDIAVMMNYHKKLKLNNGILITNPIPKAAELADDQLIPIVKQAQNETQVLNGKAITPVLLSRIAELTAGQSLNANIELIKSNAILGAEIAIAYQSKSPERN